MRGTLDLTRRQNVTQNFARKQAIDVLHCTIVRQGLPAKRDRLRRAGFASRGAGFPSGHEMAMKRVHALRLAADSGALHSSF